MDAPINAYLSVLRKTPSLLEIAMDVALEDLEHIAANSGSIERLSANVISMGQSAHARHDVRQLQTALNIHRRAVVHRHAFFHRRHAHRLALPYQAKTRSGARAEAADQNQSAEMHDFRPDISVVIDESLAAMCGSELVSLQESILRLGQEGGLFPLRSPARLASLSQGLTFAIAPAWPRTLPSGLAAYIGYLYGDVMCTTLQELMQLVEQELHQKRNHRAQLSGRTDSGFTVTMPCGERPPTV